MMPYIKPESRTLIDKHIDPVVAHIDNEGELNYAITRLVHLYILQMGGVRYTILNSAFGVLNCVANELYRRIAASYEDTKISENGDVDVL